MEHSTNMALHYSTYPLFWKKFKYQAGSNFRLGIYEDVRPLRTKWDTQHGFKVGTMNCYLGTSCRSLLPNIGKRRISAVSFRLRFLIHEADPQSRPVVITILALGVCTSVRPYFLKSRKTKQLSSEDSDCYWQDYGSSWVDHWWHTCLVTYIVLNIFFKWRGKIFWMTG